MSEIVDDLEEARDIERHTLEWRGIGISVSFERCYLACDYISHLQVESVLPEKAALPITETGYRSHFLHCGDVDAAGGPLAYVTTWLDAEAEQPDWREREQTARQMSLF